MTLEKLQENILVWQVPESLYSINDGLKPNAYIILENYGKWEFFFLDEKGDRSLGKVFDSSGEAFNFLWEKLFLEMQYPLSNAPSSVYS